MRGLFKSYICESLGYVGGSEKNRDLQYEEKYNSNEPIKRKLKI